MNTKLMKISLSKANALYDGGKTIHAISPLHKGELHMAYKVSPNSGQSFNEAHSQAKTVMEMRTGSPDINYHEEVLMSVDTTPDVDVPINISIPPLYAGKDEAQND